MRALPEGVTVYAGGREWIGEVPDEFYPGGLEQPAVAPAGKTKGSPAAPEEGAPGA